MDVTARDGTSSQPEDPPTSNEQVLLRDWLRARAPSTQRAYRASVARFRAYTDKPLGEITDTDMLEFASALAAEGLTSRTCARLLGAVRGFLTFAHKAGHTSLDAGNGVDLPARGGHIADLSHNGAQGEASSRAKDTRIHTDPLTGALLRAALASAFAAARRHASTVSLIDRSRSLQEYQRCIRARCRRCRVTGVRCACPRPLRSGDSLIRYGGDEFIVLLPNAQLATTQEVAERLLARVSSQPFPGTPPLTVTLSIGCASTDAATGDISLEALLARADAHLYQAKRRGRNQVVSPEQASPTLMSLAVAADAEGRLLERDDAYTQMLAWLDAMSDGERGLLRVFGAPGVGLTRFLQAVASTARLRGYETFALTGSMALRSRQYGALAEALGDTATDAGPPDLQQVLAALQPGGAGGFLVIVDRASQIDAATLTFLRQLLSHPAVGRVGLVVGLPPGLVEMGWLPDLPVRVEVWLRPLSLAALRVWLRGALHWEAPAEFSAWLHRQTDGYPALLQAAVRQLAGDAMLTQLPEGAGWQVSPFFQEYPLRDWLVRTRAREEEASSTVQPYGQLIGRNAEMRALKQAVAEQKVVVLAGPGGVGKTYLALQAAAELGPTLPTGWSWPLDATTALEFVASAPGSCPGAGGHRTAGSARRGA